MFSAIKSKSAMSLIPTKSNLAIEERLAKSAGRIPFFGGPRLSNISHASSVSYDSEEEDVKQSRLRRFETRRQMTKTLSRTRRGLLRLTNWAYEREWRRERKYSSFDPIVVRIGTSHMTEIQCDCLQCPCKHDKFE